MQFIGHTRFSVYSYQSDKFAATRGKSDEKSYRNWLYAPERMAPRTEIFINESLPQIQRAMGETHQVAHVVCYSPSLPDEYLSALQNAEHKYEFLHLYEVNSAVSGTAPPVEAIRAVAGWTDGQTQRLGIYRLDDDDLIAEDYFDRMARYGAAAEPGWRVSLGYGFSAIRSKGEYYFARRDYHPMASVGMMSVAQLNPEGELEGLHDTAHQYSDTGGPVIVDSEHPGFFRTRHSGQDNILAKYKGQDFLSAAVAEMRRWQPQDVKDVVAKFPILQGRVHKALTPVDSAVNLVDSPIELSAEPTRFNAPFQDGCVLVMELEGRFEKGQVKVRYSVSADEGQDVADKATREYFSAQLVDYDQESGYFEPVATNERGPKRHLVIRCPEGLRLEEVAVISKRKKNPVILKELSVRPLLDTDASAETAVS
ncbi:glycosyltransferase [Nesterenkonia massiliensis]|uniref:glycosyltransferase n=1 Tax=Nesterenkonia massiliensis TaxID=1232429 RepID=UPI0004038BF7|nr:glycosyltransferase [Nesterenkonia massiliensis]